MNILLHGCNGRMGQVITRITSQSDDKIVCGVDISEDKFQNPYPVYRSLIDVVEDVGVLIDFSNHTCLSSIIEFGLRTKTPLVICTTGFTPEEKNMMYQASKNTAILNSANMSIGINLIVSLIKQAARSLKDDFDIEIIEKHHNMKLDSPSGTAIMLADSIKDEIGDMEYVYGRHSKSEKRDKKQIGLHAIRGGSIVGEHEVIFAGSGEVIEINHSAISRDVFAYGALRAARFMLGKANGFYTMKDVLGE